MQDKIEKGRKLLASTWRRANFADAMVKSGKSRLASFPLIIRILLFPRFGRIRSIIEDRETRRFNLVFMAIGMAKQLNRIERAINAESDR